MDSSIVRAPAHICLLVVAVTTFAGCAAAPEPPAPPQEEVPHGYVEGAEETAEAQSRLVVADDETGQVRVVDLISEDVIEVAAVSGVEHIAGDGRFAYLTTADRSMHVVDSGTWMVDHGDHVHYYRAKVRDIGPLAGSEPTDVHSDPAVSAVAHADGTVQLLDRAQLDTGVIAPTGTITAAAHQAHAVPYREHVLVSVAEPGHEYAGAVEVRGRQGEPVATIDTPCPELQGSAVTRRGAVFGCADGALLVAEKEGVFSGEKIPYPRPVAAEDRVREFTLRPGSATLTAKAGEQGVWSLDVTRKAWTHLETGPVVAVNAVGEGAPLLALTADGVLHAFDAATGQETAQTVLLDAPLPADVPAPVIQVDTTRAYVNDPTGGAIHEIDYNDDLRLARTFEIAGKASHMVETGR